MTIGRGAFTHGRGIGSPAAALTILTIVSFATGLLLGIVTIAVERAGIEGAGWSSRGNGALIVPACGFPVILLIGLTFLARALEADPLSCLAGPSAGLLALIVAGTLSSLASRLLLSLVLLVAIGAALFAARGSGRSRAAGWLMAGAISLSAAVYGGILVGGSLIPQ